MSDYVDLTGSDDEIAKEPAGIGEEPNDQPEEPVGVNICPDFVDMQDSSSGTEDEKEVEDKSHYQVTKSKSDEVSMHHRHRNLNRGRESWKFQSDQSKKGDIASKTSAADGTSKRGQRKRAAKVPPTKTGAKRKAGPAAEASPNEMNKRRKTKRREDKRMNPNSNGNSNSETRNPFAQVEGNTAINNKKGGQSKGQRKRKSRESAGELAVNAFRSIFPDFDRLSQETPSSSNSKVASSSGEKKAANTENATKTKLAPKKTRDKAKGGRKSETAGRSDKKVLTTEDVAKPKSPPKKRGMKNSPVEEHEDVVDLCDDDIHDGLPQQESFNAPYQSTTNPAINAFVPQFHSQRGTRGRDKSLDESKPASSSFVKKPMLREVPDIGKGTVDHFKASRCPVLSEEGPAAVQFPMKGTGMVLPVMASVWEEEARTSQHLMGRSVASALSKEKSNDGDMAPSPKSDEPPKKRSVNSPPKQKNDTPTGEELESPVGVNICVDVVDLCCNDDDDDDDDMPVSVQDNTKCKHKSSHAHTTKAQEHTRVESPSVRKVSVSGETGDLGGSEGICALGGGVVKDHKQDPVENTSSMQNIECSQSNNLKCFRPTKPPLRPIAKLQPAKTQHTAPTGHAKASVDAEMSSCRNFVFVDCGSDDEEDDYCYITDVKPMRKQIHQMKPKTHSARSSGSNSDYSSFYIPMHHKNNGKPQSKAPANPIGFGGFSSQEAAAETQDRLFREAADRMRKRVEEDPTFYRPAPVDDSRSFPVPVPDVFKQYPNHWQWKDPYARLGLPQKSPVALVKKHYRKLALVYHPDKLRAGESPEKFHAITAAYRKLIG